MSFQRMKIEDWFDRYQYMVDVNIGESGIKYKSLSSLGIDLSTIELRYGHHLGAPDLREEIAKEYKGLSGRQIGVTTGASEAIFCVIASLVGHGDQIIVEHPNYPSIYEVAKSLDRDLVLFPLSFNDDFRPNLENLEQFVSPKTRLIALTHPNNPTGSVITRGELDYLIRFAEKRGIYLLLDETYRQLSFESPPPPAATLSPLAISITSMSKAFSVPGIRIGWVAAQQKIIDQVRVVREQITICNSVISETIAIEILKKRREFLMEAKQSIFENLEILKNWMDDHKDFEWVYPKGGVVCFPRLANHTDSTALCELLVKKYHTFVVPGYCFEMPQYLRIGFGGEKTELVTGLDNLDRGLNDFEEYKLFPNFQ